MPQCKKENTFPIVYGFIDNFGANEKDYEVGGCVVTGSVLQQIHRFYILVGEIMLACKLYFQ